MAISKEQAKIYQLLQKDVIQHVFFGLFIFLITFSFFAIHAWYQEKLKELASLVYKREAFRIVFQEALVYTLLMGVPVYVNLFFIYKGRMQDFLARRIFTKADLQGWGFYIFLFFSFITAFVFSLLYAPLIKPPLFDLIDQSWYEIVIIILFLILCTTGVSFTKETLQQQRKLERNERQEAIRKKRWAEQELQFLKKQIRPHFLFNTLANLQALARRHSEKLPDLIGELSHLLRHLVYRTNERFVALEEELTFIECYINLQLLQLSKGTDFCFEVKGTPLPKHRIAPMILLLFVENCFKHYNSRDDIGKFIHIHFCIHGDALEAHISNSYKANRQNEGHFDEKKAGGLGLAGARENLDLIYGDRCHMEIKQEPKVFMVLLKVPIL